MTIPEFTERLNSAIGYKAPEQIIHGKVVAVTDDGSNTSFDVDGVETVEYSYGTALYIRLKERKQC